MDKQKKVLLILFSSLVLAMMLTGVIVDGWQKTVQGFIYLQTHPARLLNDFFAISGIGATLWNAALVGLLAFVLVLVNKIKLSGPVFAAVFTIVGFGMFGKTLFNIIPIILGVYLAAKVVGKSFQEYIIIGLFGTALGPLVSFFAFEIGLTGVTGMLIGFSAGIVTGFILPGLALSMLHMHQGYNLYNIGLTSGFFGIFAAAFIKASGHVFTPQLVLFEYDNPILIWIVPVISLLLILTGIIISPKTAWRDFLKIQKHSGRLPSDFMSMTSLSGALINAGLIGIFGSAIVHISGAQFNGPVIGGLLTIIGFGAFGTHLKNSWPIVTGVVLSCLVFGKSLSEPGPILAVIFGTTLAPIAGQFGIIIGIIAGFIHLALVSQTGSWHGGMSLYNNGFAGGLTATFLVAIIQWYTTNKNNNISGR